MNELGKVKRVIEKLTSVDEVLLVLDATTAERAAPGPGVRRGREHHWRRPHQAGRHREGGIVIAVQRELGVPVKLVGLGEGRDDLAPFDPRPLWTRSSPDRGARHARCPVFRIRQRLFRIRQRPVASVRRRRPET